ncbi:MAG: hypothetical protein OXC37_02910 [Bdellovibrionaceae bacterium]|nr:hypothetical protein [Pseudobdellovibrionaceae bacterium]
MRALILLFFTGVMLSCAQKISLFQASSVDESYNSNPFDSKNFMTCNLFSDITFRGYVYRPASKDNCFHLDIIESPKELLKNEDLFLQIYPFRFNEDNIEYGLAKKINTVAKFNTEDILIQSSIIDTHIVQVELDLESDQFFLDHVLEVCDLDDKWQGLQIVIYERRDASEDAIPIRVTKFLNPPFLIHPEHFREEMGLDLAAYHPFLDYIPKFKSEPTKYYDLAEDFCSHL